MTAVRQGGRAVGGSQAVTSNVTCLRARFETNCSSLAWKTAAAVSGCNAPRTLKCYQKNEIIYSSTDRSKWTSQGIGRWNVRLTRLQRNGIFHCVTAGERAGAPTFWPFSLELSAQRHEILTTTLMPITGCVFRNKVRMAHRIIQIVCVKHEREFVAEFVAQ